MYRIITALIAWALLTATLAANAASTGDAKRGAYLAKAAGCVGCHTVDKPGAALFAGGRALQTPFGTFYGPNITPHPEAGIGKWSEANFAEALRHGTRPDGANYFPAFPYTSFTRITDADVHDLWAFLRSLPPSPQPSRPHELKFPYNQRLGVTLWKLLYFDAGEFKSDPRATAEVNRGAYLVTALGHCGECHTPRNAIGGPRKDRILAGGKGPEGKGVPNLTPTRLKAKYDDKELAEFLTDGTTPDGDMASRTMEEVIRNTTSQLTPADLKALIAYLRALPPIENEKK